MFEVISVAGKVWASLVSESGPHIAKVICNNFSKENGCMLSIVYLKGNNGFEIFDVQVELTGKS